MSFICCSNCLLKPLSFTTWPHQFHLSPTRSLRHLPSFISLFHSLCIIFCKNPSVINCHLRTVSTNFDQYLSCFIIQHTMQFGTCVYLYNYSLIILENGLHHEAAHAFCVSVMKWSLRENCETLYIHVYNVTPIVQNIQNVEYEFVKSASE